MLKKIGEKIFGTSDEREIKKMQKLVDKINEVEPLFEKKKDCKRKHVMIYWLRHLQQSGKPQKD